MIDIVAIITAGAAVIAAGAASFAAWFTYQIMRSGQQQVEVSQQEVCATLKAQQDGQLPILMPDTQLVSVGQTQVDSAGHSIQPTQAGYDQNAPFVRVWIRNVGAGPALNIRGIVFGPRSKYDAGGVIGQRYSATFPAPLAAGAAIPPDEKPMFDWGQGGIAVSGDTKIGGHTLYPPSKPTEADIMRGIAEMTARLTLTYSDIFGRRHAAIYDLTSQNRWVSVAYVPNITEGLGDLEREALKEIPMWKAPQISRATD